MAIKGKRKGKARSGRVVTPGPRPAYVPPRVPLLARPGAKFVVALVLEAIVFALVVGFAEQSQTERQREAIDEFTSLVEAALSQGEAIQQLPTSFLVLPQLNGRLEELTGGEPADPEAVITEAEGWATAMTDAASGLAEIEVPASKLDQEQNVALTDARNLMERGLVTYAGVAQQVALAAELEGEQQEQLIQTIRQQSEVATSIFNAGYAKLQRARGSVGLSTTRQAPAGGLPGGVPGLEPPGEQIPIDVGGGDVEGGGGGGQGGNAGNGGGGGNG